MFTAPNVGPLGAVLEFILTVVDTSNLSDTDSVKISVIDKPDDSVDEENSPPTADAGPDQNDVMEFSKVTLDGSSSTDPDGDPISYHWTQVFGTSVTLSSNTAVSPMFTAPDVGPLGDMLGFMLAVVDTSNETDTDTVKITVNEKNGNQGNGNQGNGNQGNGNQGSGGQGSGGQGISGQTKVTLCHIPPGNPDARHIITVGAPAVPTHLAHGDELNPGECEVIESTESSNNNSGKGNSGGDNSGKGNSNNKDDNEIKSNSGKGNNNDDDDRKGNSGKGNSNNNNENLKIKSNENEDEDEHDDEDEDD